MTGPKSKKSEGRGGRGLLRELARRHVVPTAIGYSVSAWLVIEIASVVLDAFNSPDWALQGLIVLAVVGFPVAVVISWIFDITPAGVVRTEEMEEAPAAAAKKVKARAVTERRQLTVLRTQLVWTDAEGELADAEDIRGALGELREALDAVATHCKGTLWRLDPGQVVMYFGYPQAHEEDARHAAQAALAVAQEVRKLNATQRAPHLTTRTGLDVGVAIIEGGADAAAAQIVGNLLETAEWLITFCDDDRIMVSQAAHDLLSGYFTLRHVADYRRTHARKSVAVYELQGASGVRTRLEARARLSDLIGRDYELSLLHQRWAQACDGRGQVVVISGESGLGKSRLVHELKQSVAEEDGGSVFELLCFADYQSTALYPVRQFLEEAVQRQVPSPAAAGLDVAGVEALLARAGLEQASGVPLLANLLGLDLADSSYAPLELAPALRKARTLELLLQLLLAPTRDGSLLLLVEDYHWADPSLCELVEALVAQGTGMPLLLVLTMRPQGNPDWIGRTHVTQLSVSPLTDEQTRTLVTSLGSERELPSEVVERLADHSQGNPLFAEELTRGVLHQEQPAGAAGGDHLAVPLTLQESLLARLDQLTPDTKILARLAATIGREFEHQLAEAFAQSLQVEDFPGHLRELIDADIIYQRGMPPNAVYSFRHVLLQEAAYQSILRQEREEYHGKIAELLREQFPAVCEASPEVLARHVTLAGRVVEAIPLWLSAGSQASRQAAHREASNLLRHALHLLERLPPSHERDAMELDLQIVLGPALMAIRGYSASDVRESYKRAEQLLDRAESTIALAPVLFGLWTHHVVAGNLTRAMGLGERLQSLAASSANEDLLLESHVLLGVTQSYIGPMEEALQHLEAATALYAEDRHAGHAYVYGQDPQMASISYAAIAHWWLGRTQTAGRCVEESIAHARRLNHPRSLAFALVNGARTQLKRGDYLRCIEIAEEAVELSEKHGYPDFLAMGQFHRVASEFRAGKRDGTLEEMQQSLEALVSVGNSLSVPYYHSVVADALSEEGHYEQALARLESADGHLSKHGHDLDVAEIDRVRGLVHWRRQRSASGDEDPAPERHLCRACELAQRQGAVSWQLLAAVSLGQYLAATDRVGEARGVLEAALASTPERGHLPVFNDAVGLLDRM